MNPRITDHRKPEEIRESDTLLVIGTDRILSGWGKAQDQTSLAGWVCNERNWTHVFNWVLRRGDMKRVRYVLLKDYRPRPGYILSIYPTPPAIVSEISRLDAMNRRDPKE